MKKLLVFLLLATCYLLPATALAQEPTPETPYHFEPVTVDPQAAPSLPLPSVYTPDFINALGSYALTVFTMLDQWNVLGIVVVIMLGLSALWWLYSFVTSKPIRSKLDLSGAIDTADDLGYVDEDTSKLARYLIKNRNRFRF